MTTARKIFWIVAVCLVATAPAVAEVGVWKIPDDILGEAVKAWVVLQAGQQAFFPADSVP